MGAAGFFELCVNGDMRERRHQSIGMVDKILFVVYAEEGLDDTRLISTRLATPKERRIYHGRDDAAGVYGWERINF